MSLLERLGLGRKEKSLAVAEVSRIVREDKVISMSYGQIFDLFRYIDLRAVPAIPPKRMKREERLAWAIMNSLSSGGVSSAGIFGGWERKLMDVLAEDVIENHQGERHFDESSFLEEVSMSVSSAEIELIRQDVRGQTEVVDPIIERAMEICEEMRRKFDERGAQ